MRCVGFSFHDFFKRGTNGIRKVAIGGKKCNYLLFRRHCHKSLSNKSLYRGYYHFNNKININKRELVSSSGFFRSGIVFLNKRNSGGQAGSRASKKSKKKTHTIKEPSQPTENHNSHQNATDPTANPTQGLNEPLCIFGHGGQPIASSKKKPKPFVWEYPAPLVFFTKDNEVLMWAEGVLILEGFRQHKTAEEAIEYTLPTQSSEELNQARNISATEDPAFAAFDQDSHMQLAQVERFNPGTKIPNYIINFQDTSQIGSFYARSGSIINHFTKLGVGNIFDLRMLQQTLLTLKTENKTFNEIWLIMCRGSGQVHARPINLISSKHKRHPSPTQVDAHAEAKKRDKRFWRMVSFAHNELINHQSKLRREEQDTSDSEDIFGLD